MIKIKKSDLIKEAALNSFISVVSMLFLLLLFLFIGVQFIKIDLGTSICVFMLMPLFAIMICKTIIDLSMINSGRIVIMRDTLIDKTKSHVRECGYGRVSTKFLKFKTVGDVIFQSKYFKNAVIGNEYYVVLLESDNSPIGIFNSNEYLLDEPLALKMKNERN